MKTRLLIIIFVISFVSIFPIFQAFGIGAPPPERVPVSVWGIYDLQGNKLELVQVGEQIQIVSDLANTQNIEQSLAYIVEVYDEDGNKVYKNWIEATLGPMGSFSPVMSWVTETPGYYAAKIMVWEALDNSSSLSPTLELEFYVVGDLSVLNENKSCPNGKELVFKINYKKISCVFPETLVQLLARGWANWHDWYSPLFIDNLRQGPQNVDVIHAEFIKREVMKDSKVKKHFLLTKNYDYTCCSYLYDDDSLKYQLVINFSDLPNDKQLVVVYDLWQTKVVETKLKDMIQLGGPIISELESENKFRSDDRFQIKHSAGYTTVYITLSSWDEYYQWEKDRGTEHDAMPPVIIDDTNINPIVYDLLSEMWKFEDYEVSRYDDNLFTKNIEKDYPVSNHDGIHDWLESEYKKQFGASKDGFSNHFEYGDNVYIVTMVVW